MLFFCINPSLSAICVRKWVVMLTNCFVVVHQQTPSSAAFVVRSERATVNEFQRGPISTQEAGLIMGRVWSLLIRLQTGRRKVSIFLLSQDPRCDFYLCLFGRNKAVIYDIIWDWTNKNKSINCQQKKKLSRLWEIWSGRVNESLLHWFLLLKTSRGPQVVLGISKVARCLNV